MSSNRRRGRILDLAVPQENRLVDEYNDRWVSAGPAPSFASRLALQGDSNTYDILDALEGVLNADSSAEVVEIWVGPSLVGHTSRALLDRELGSDIPVTGSRAVGDGDP